MAHAKRDVTHKNIFASLNSTFTKTYKKRCENSEPKLLEQWFHLQNDVRTHQNLIINIYLFSSVKSWKIFFSLNVVVSTE